MPTCCEPPERIADPLEFEPMEEVMLQLHKPIARAFHRMEQHRINVILRRTARSHPSLFWLAAGRQDDACDGMLFDEGGPHALKLPYKPASSEHLAQATEQETQAIQEYTQWFTDFVIMRQAVLLNTAQRAFIEAIDDRARSPCKYAAYLLGTDFRYEALRDVFGKRSIARRYLALAREEIPRAVQFTQYALPLIARAEGKTLEELTIEKPSRPGIAHLQIAYSDSTKFCDSVVFPSKEALGVLQEKIDAYYARVRERAYEHW